MNKLICWFKGHTWHNDKHYPTHGYDVLSKPKPTPGSYCTRCHTTGAA